MSTWRVFGCPQPCSKFGAGGLQGGACTLQIWPVLLGSWGSTSPPLASREGGVTVPGPLRTDSNSVRGAVCSPTALGPPGQHPLCLLPKAGALCPGLQGLCCTPGSVRPVPWGGDSPTDCSAVREDSSRRHPSSGPFIGLSRVPEGGGGAPVPIRGLPAPSGGRKCSCTLLVGCIRRPGHPWGGCLWVEEAPGWCRQGCRRGGQRCAGCQTEVMGSQQGDLGGYGAHWRG